MWIKRRMGINPLAHFLDLLFIGRYDKREVGTFAAKALIKLKFVVRIDLYFTTPEILIEKRT